jgi:hypothetical protein
MSRSCWTGRSSSGWPRTAGAGTGGLRVPGPGDGDGARAGVEAYVRYLYNNKEYLRYDEALASGWPIATGVI